MVKYKFMFDLIKVVANIELFSGENVRKIPIISGYRPLFNFENEKTKISGQIDLIEMPSFEPGMKGIVQITFIKGMIKDSHFIKGEKFTFDEGRQILGNGEITEIIRK
jgi:translation elongation factor EF-Tu-like GTPase